jgi:hypothetical protein
VASKSQIDDGGVAKLPNDTSSYPPATSVRAAGLSGDLPCSGGARHEMQRGPRLRLITCFSPYYPNSICLVFKNFSPAGARAPAGPAPPVHPSKRIDGDEIARVFVAGCPVARRRCRIGYLLVSLRRLA